MEHYESPEITLDRAAEDIYNRFSSFDALTPAVAGKVDNWRTDGETCSFTAKGFPFSLRISEREPGRSVTVVPEGSSPFQFVARAQLNPLSPVQSTLRISLDIALNPMLKMMVGPQIEKALASLAAGIK